MKRDAVWMVILIVGFYLWWRWKNKSNLVNSNKYNMGPATKTLSTERFHIPLYNPRAGNGRGVSIAPTVRVGSSTTASGNRTIGSARRSGILSRPSNNKLSGYISATLPSESVSSTGIKRIQSGNIQVPSYTAIPINVIGPGGVGALWNRGAIEQGDV